MTLKILTVPARQVAKQSASTANLANSAELAEPVEVNAPASKSLSHRMLVAAALARDCSPSVLHNVLQSEDTAATMRILQACGAKFKEARGSLEVLGLSGQIQGGAVSPLECNVAESGTTARLLTAILAAGNGLFRLHGAKRMHERPMQALTKTLTQLGAAFSFEQSPGSLPFTLKASGLENMPVEIDTSQSSQYLSGLLLAAPLGQGLTLIPTASALPQAARSEASPTPNLPKLVSWPYVLLTLQVLHDFGVPFEVQLLSSQGIWQKTHWQQVKSVEPGQVRLNVSPALYQPGEYRVEGDYSSASYLLAAGALGPKAVKVHNLNRCSLQGDQAILDILKAMGAKITWHSNAVTVAPPKPDPATKRQSLRGINVNMADCPDLVPTVAALAAFATGPTSITGVAHLRIKESDRIAAPAAELRKVGCQTKELPDGLQITPPERLQKPNAPFRTYNDHRMAMSAALFSCAGFDVQIENPDCVAKSFPGFWQVWGSI